MAWGLKLTIHVQRVSALRRAPQEDPVGSGDSFLGRLSSCSMHGLLQAAVTNESVCQGLKDSCILHSKTLTTGLSKQSVQLSHLHLQLSS